MVAAATFGAGCAGQMLMMEPPPTVVLAIEPGDGVTAWQGRDITIAVEDAGRLLGPEWRTGLADHFYLRTWPEGVPIAVTAETVPGPTDAQWGVRLTPALTLDDGWYVVGASDLPSRIISTQKLPDGTIGARFSPGSHPRVAAVQLCGQDQAGTRVMLSFSEPVSLPADVTQAVAVAVNSRPAACSSAGVDAAAAYMTCPELPAAASVTVSVPEGLAGPGGVPIESGAWTIDVGQLPAGGCQTYKPPLTEAATLAAVPGAAPATDLPAAGTHGGAIPAGWHPAVLHPRE